MGLFTPENNEYNLLSTMFNEAARLFGNSVTVKISHIKDNDIYNDPTYEYESEQEIDIIFEDTPRLKTLKELNWFSEDADILPLLAYISTQDINNLKLSTLRGTLLEIPYKLDNGYDTNKFEIADTRGLGPSQVYWVCKLVPYRVDNTQGVKDKVGSDKDQDDNFGMIKFDK
ncbi:hypothetical protein LIS04_66 [Listeria phage LIS04]|nr:hypothetical protein LIS04_66 [Listeria phage LIS04]